VPDVYAVGDCAQFRNPREGRNSIDAVWYTGRMAGENVAYNVCGHEIAYDPGIWYNSAKFFDIEYQVYGTIIPDAPEDHMSIFWKHPDDRKSIRLVYERDSCRILGFNLFGVRYRQEVCEKWIREKTHVEQVLQDLGLANFDPEFYREYEQDVLDQYQRQSGRTVRLKTRRGLSASLRFLQKV
jgi:NAD(P)H-nitrite reductase large subunit